MFRGIVIASLTAALAACAAPSTPVPVVGAPSDVAQLGGEWEGQYSSVETGRSGSIFFHIVPGTDSSHGDVLMDPAVLGMRRAAGDPTAVGQPAVRPGQAIGITFVRVAGGRISGRLEPYTDPDCNCPLYTTFEGAQRRHAVRHVLVAPRDRRLHPARRVARGAQEGVTPSSPLPV